MHACARASLSSGAARESDARILTGATPCPDSVHPLHRVRDTTPAMGAVLLAKALQRSLLMSATLSGP